MNKEKIATIFSIFEQINPHPKTELAYINDYTLLIAVVLSAQATDVGVNKATKNLFKVVQTPKQMLSLGIDKLISYIKTIGLFNAKAKNVMALSKILLDEHGGAVPSSRKLLESLPGVGRKTANVVLNVAFNQPTMAVDTHIFRVSNRIGIALGKTPLEVEKNLLKNIPSQYLQHAHHWLILHGRYICKARKPNCHECPINKLCKFYEGL